MKYSSVCSGVEAASLAWIPIGWKAAWFSEIEPFPCSVLAERFPDVPNLGDMTKIKVENLENGDTKFTGESGSDVVVSGGIDLLVGGTPCQDASVAGKRAGLVEGSRSRLAFDFTRIAYESKAKWIVWENVPGVFSLNKGRDFAAFLSSLAGWDVAVPDGGGWKNAGIVRNATDGNFGLAYRVLDAQYVRVDGFARAIPQRRRRVFVVGYFGDWTRAASVLLESEGLYGNSPPCRVTRKGFTAYIESRSGESGFIQSSFGGMRKSETSGTIRNSGGDIGGGSETLINQQNIHRIRWGGDGMTCPALQANLAKQLSNQTPIVCGRPWDNSGVNPTLNQSSSESGIIGSSNQELFSQNMNGIVIEKTVSIGNGQLGEIKASLEECSQTLHCMHDHSAIVCVHGSQDPICNSSHSNAVNRNNGLENVVCISDMGGAFMSVEKAENAPTIRSQMHGHTPVVCYDNQTYAREPKDTGDISCTLQAHCGTGGNTVPLVQNVQTEHHHAVAIAENIIGRKDDTGGNGNGYTEELAYTQNATGVMGVSQNATVRRLMPVECERLMGFPDNWTRIPWKGKPAEECPDSHRYKACGNSMCVNVMRWIGMRIELEERKNKK